jgi:hypothetical protein
MNDYSLDPNQPKRSKIHAGFLVGLIAAAIMVVVQLFFLLIFRGTNNGDWIALGIQLFVYFFASQAAAQRHYDTNISTNNIEPLAGVRAAGIGAAITTSLIMWFYIFVRGIVRDALGIQILIEPISLFFMIVVDVLLAIGLGAWGGTIVVNRYKIKGY